MTELPRSTDNAAIDEIVQMIEASGLDPICDIGELIHDIAEHYGAEAANSAEDEDEADEIIDAWSEAGSDVNNDGVEVQAAVLVDFHGLDGAREAIAALG